MKRLDYEALIHECQLEVDKKNTENMSKFLHEALDSVKDEQGNISACDAYAAVYYAASKLAVGMSAAITGKIIEKLGIVTLED